MLAHSALAEFVAEHGLRYVNTLRAMIDTLLAEHRIPAGSGPTIALLDSPSSFPTFAPRLHEMVALLADMGVEAVAGHYGQLARRDGRTELAGRPVQAVLRYTLVEEVDTPELATMMESVAVPVTSRLDAELYGNKGALAMLTDDRYRDSFSSDERSFVRRILPWTRPFRACGTDPGGTITDLAAYARARQEELILKPTNLHGGHGIVPGWRVDPAEWSAAVDSAVDGPYVLQQRVRPMPEPFDDGGTRQDLYLNWGVFLVDPAVSGSTDGYGGCIVRGTTDPNVGIVSMGSGARVGCCFTE